MLSGNRAGSLKGGIATMKLLYFLKFGRGLPHRAVGIFLCKVRTENIYMQFARFATKDANCDPGNGNMCGTKIGGRNIDELLCRWKRAGFGAVRFFILPIAFHLAMAISMSQYIICVSTQRGTLQEYRF